MNGRTAFGIALAVALAASFGGGRTLAYNRYNDGCNSCHGAFTDATSPKGNTIPGNNKHTMHRSSSYMKTACVLCHRFDDANNPFIGSSDGTATNPGIGCTGCHVAAGLRLHHANSGVPGCASCHTASTPQPESVPPPYYGTADTKAASPCNSTASSYVNENWTVNCCEGSDTDGDLLYDMADPDCSGPVPTPGEAGATQDLLVTGYDKISGAVSINFGAACSATNNTIEYGPLSSVSTYGYSGQVCNIGTAGTAAFTLPSDAMFFLVVARNSTKEGSYGLRRTGTLVAERPEDTLSAACPLPQDLTARCD